MRFPMTSPRLAEHLELRQSLGRPHLPVRVAVVLSTALLLAACGNKEGGANTSGSTQVAAKVGKDEISIHQVNQAMTRVNMANASTPQAAEALRRDVLERLIDQQLAIEQAKEKKLDRSPEVVAQLEAARREVLARAYAQSIATSQPRPTPDEVKKYFADHPQLFSQRRIYNLQELQVPVGNNPSLANEAKAMAAAGKSVEDIANWLRGQNIKFGGGGATRAAEQIPLEVLARLHTMKDGQVTVLDSPQGFTVLRIAASQSAPVTETVAIPRIEQFLSNQRGAQAVSQQMKDLRAKTEIAYMGDFAKAAGTPPSAASAPSATGANDASTPAAPNVLAPPQTASDNPANDPNRAAIEKGISGLVK